MDELFSYSKIDTFEQCGFKYWLKYVEGHSIINNSIALEFGTLVHETEEAIAKSIMSDINIDYIKLKNNFIKKIYELQYKYCTDFYTVDKSDRTYQDKVYFYLEHGIYRLEKYVLANPSLRIVGAEVGFNIKYTEYALRGFIDRIFLNTTTNKYIVQDIKTYPVPVDNKKLATPLQFVVYTLAMKELYNCTENDITCSYDLPLCDIVQSAGMSGYMNRGLKKLDNLFTEIENKNFVPNPTPLCHWCEYCPTNQNATEEGKWLCPYFSHWTKENKQMRTENKWLGMIQHKNILENYHKVYQVQP